MKTLHTFGLNFVTSLAGNDACEFPVLHRRRLSGFFNQTRFVQINGRKTSAHRSLIAYVPDQSARVYALNRNYLPTLQVSIQRLFRAPVRRHAARFSDNEAFDPGTRGFRILARHAVVADERICHADDLPGVGWIGQNLLITGHGSIEHHLAARFALRAPRTTKKRAPIFEREQSRF